MAVSTGRLRARDIREQLKGKIDPALLHTLEMLAEQDGILRQQVMKLAEMFNDTQDLLNKLIGVLKIATDKVDAVAKLKENAVHAIETQEIIPE